MKSLLVVLSVVCFLLPARSFGYPNGTPQYVTDLAPFCASCHSAATIEYMPESPHELAQKELTENKHYALVRSPSPPSPYIELSSDQKEELIRTAQFIDSHSSVFISAPAQAKPGEEVKVQVEAKGGNGPVIGVVLVDKPLRYQARPVSSDSWVIIGDPEIRGQNGTVQRKWLESRAPGLGRNLNYILVTDQKFDKEKRIFPSGKITYTLKAPSVPGTYSITTAFLYGTENTDTAGFFQRPSGRILFSKEITVVVK